MSVDFADHQSFVSVPWTTTGHSPRFTNSTLASPPVVHLLQPSASGSGAILSVLSAKISSLLSLEDGWNGPGSRRPAEAPFKAYLEFLSTLGALPTLDVEPVATSDGGLEVEWEVDDNEFTIEFQPDGQIWLCSDDSDQYVDAPAAAADFYRMSRQVD